MRIVHLLLMTALAIAATFSSAAAATLNDCENLRHSKPADSVAACSAVIAAGGAPGDISRAYASRGYAYIELGQTANALADQSTAISLDATNSFAWHERGWIHNELGNYQDGIRDLTESLRLNSERTASHSERGWAYLQLGKYSEALADYTQAIVRDPDNASYYEERAKAFDGLGRTQEAAADRKRAEFLKAQSAGSK